MLKKSCAAPSQLRSLKIGLGLLVCIWSADNAFADTTQVLGTVNFTLTTYPGAPTNPGGGGPFELTFDAAGSTATLSPATLLNTYKIPNSVLIWCNDLHDEITPGNENTGVSLILHSASLLGGLIAEGSLWLNNVTGGVNLDAAGLAEFHGFTETALQISAVIQDEIWANSGQQSPIPSSIAGINSTDLAAIESLIMSFATSHYSGYISLEQVGLQTQVFSVPGPIAGAGLPGLLAACGGLIALARRRRKIAFV
jgi:hypothetical protein